MYQDDLARIVTEELFAPRALLLYAGLTAFDLAVGYASWRALVRLPDFPYRREMLWGARWMWAVIAAVLGAAITVTYYGAVYTNYPLTSVILGGAVFTLGMHQTMLLLPMRGDGWSFCLTALGARLRGKQLDLNAWVTKRVRQYHNPWLKYGLGRGMAIALLLMYAYIVLATTYPLDRDLARTDRDQRTADQVAADVRERLSSELVVDVLAFTLPDLTESDDSDLSRVKISLRDIFERHDRAPTRKPFYLHIQVTPDTSAEEGADMLARARAVLAEKKVAGKWQISVYIPDVKGLAHGEYP